MDATVTSGVAVVAGASLDWKRSSLSGLTGTGLTLAGDAVVENVLIGGPATAMELTSSMATLTASHVTLAGATSGAGVDNTAGGTVGLTHAIVYGNTGGDLVNVACSSVSWSVVASPDCSSVNDNLVSELDIYDNLRRQLYVGLRWSPGAGSAHASRAPR